MAGAVLPPLLGIGLIFPVSSAARASSEKGFTSPPAAGSPFPPTPRCPRHYLTRLSGSSPPARPSSWLSACCHQRTALRGHGRACSSRQPHGHGAWPTRAPGVDARARRAAASWGLRVACSSSCGLLHPKCDAVCPRGRDPRLLLSGSGVSLEGDLPFVPAAVVGTQDRLSARPRSTRFLPCRWRAGHGCRRKTQQPRALLLGSPSARRRAAARLLPSDRLARHRGRDDGGMTAADSRGARET